MSKAVLKSNKIKKTSLSNIYATASTTEPDVRVHIGRSIVQIQRENAVIRTIVPIAAADETARF